MLLKPSAGGCVAAGDSAQGSGGGEKLGFAEESEKERTLVGQAGAFARCAGLSLCEVARVGEQGMFSRGTSG